MDAQSDQDAGFSDAKILIADDNERNAELLEAFVEGLGCRILVSRDGPETLETIRRERPDVVLLDIMMPRMSGYQVCEAVRKDPDLSATPIIMVTALGAVNDVERAMDAGADDFLTKPISRDEVLVRVRSFLSRGRL